MTDRTQALAAQYSAIYGDEVTNDHMRPIPQAGRTTTAQCPICGTKATVLEDRVPGLLERWRREHAEHDEAERRDYAKEPA